MLAALMSVSAWAATAPTSSLAVVAQTGRTRTNFNASWRFVLGDPAHAEDPGFDDAQWRPVGLPHSFSIPYFQASTFYVGPGWYRKTFDLPALPPRRRLSLEFEGAFQTAEVFVNGRSVGRHRGGYTGFPVDITAAVHPGRNLVAVRVDNSWDPTLAPRAGEHVFSGGLYRDVWLVATDAAHVAWTGTRVTTPGLSASAGRSGRVQIDTEVRNDDDAPQLVTLKTRVLDTAGRTVVTAPDSSVRVDAGASVVASQLSASVDRPRLWSPETPALYRVETALVVAGRERDRFSTEFGFRWFSWTAEGGFFLNGRHRYFRGANVHQDQAGWGDAVTNGAIDRDVQMMKDAGFDFIRGSHYPHDPHFAEATDRIGMMFLSEAPFWGTAGFKNPWGAPSYPTDPMQQPAFDASVLQQLAEMIRINRNHPSIIDWGMDNEVFFAAEQTLPDVRRLLREEVALAHRLDPTRTASIDGAQRGDIDHLGDVAGYNGDGAALFPDPGIPNFIAEYGSTTSDGHMSYAPDWGELEKTPGAVAGDPATWRSPWRSGESIWAGFDHGSIAGRAFGSLGIVDYERLPKRAWYWYRNAYRHVPPPAWPKPGQAAALRLSASAPTIQRADGTDDVQLVVTVVDAQGAALSNSPPVRLTIESGPGEFPTGRSIQFAPDSDITIRDGRAAIAMRSWQAGTSRIRATSPGLSDGAIDIATLQGPAFVAGVTPLAPDLPYARPAGERPDEAETSFGTLNPTGASSSAAAHASRLANDGDIETFWQAAAGDTAPWWSVDPERMLEYHSVRIVFPQAAGYGVVAEVCDVGGRWRELAEEAVGVDDRKTRELVTARVVGGPLRLTITAPPGIVVGLAEVSVKGVLQTETAPSPNR